RLATSEGFDNRVEFCNRPNGFLALFVNGADRLTISQAGQVGIGTSVPTHALHVKTDSAVGLLEATSNQAFLRVATNEGLNNRVEFCNRPGGRAAIWLNNRDAFNVLQNGNVGINVINPMQILHVEGGSEIHSGGPVGGFSFANRDGNGPYVNN